MAKVPAYFSDTDRGAGAPVSKKKGPAIERGPRDRFHGGFCAPLHVAEASSLDRYQDAFFNAAAP